jgi:hypothetical protein
MNVAIFGAGYVGCVTLHGTQLVVVGKLLLPEAQFQTLCPTGTSMLDLTRQLPATLPPLRLLRFTGAAASEPAERYRR